MEEIFAEKTVANRADNLRKAEGILMEDMPIVPVVFNLNATVTSKQLKKTTTSYYNVASFRKATIKSYDNYLAAGKDYVTKNFADLKFTECNECAYKEFDLFKTANTVYSQYFLEEKENKK